MYNMLFGVNPYAGILLKILGLNRKDFGRFRDIWLDDKGRKIVVLTRNGGGNRTCDGNCDDCWWKKPYCPPEANKRLQKHPLYIKDYDDSFDHTYAYFEFRVPEKFLPLTEALWEAQGPEPSLKEKFDKILDEIDGMSPEELENDPRFGNLVKKLKTILAEVADRENE